jgi:hypothetical protein
MMTTKRTTTKNDEETKVKQIHRASTVLYHPEPHTRSKTGPGYMQRYPKMARSKRLISRIGLVKFFYVSVA